MPRKGQHHTQEAKAKLSIALRRHRARPEIQAKYRAYVPTQKTREYFSKLLMGHTVSEETRIKIGNANRGKVRTDEVKQKLSAMRMGHRLQPESYRKMADTKRGRKRPPFSEDWKRNLAKASKSIWSDPDRRRAQSIRNKKRWEDPVYRSRNIEAIWKGNSRVLSYAEQIGFCFLTTLDDEWEHNGSGVRESLIIDGFVPDYVHHSKRMVANEDGVWWHTKVGGLRTIVRDARRESAFARNGWRSFIFTDSEILANDLTPLTNSYLTFDPSVTSQSLGSASEL